MSALSRPPSCSNSTSQASTPSWLVPEMRPMTRISPILAERVTVSRVTVPRSPSADLLLGIDIGTASTKGVLTTLDGEVVATAVRKHTMSLPRPSWAEVDAERVWWDDLVEVARELMGRLDERRVAAMCVSGVGPCLLVCDENLDPVRPAILYGIDGRAE